MATAQTTVPYRAQTTTTVPTSARATAPAKKNPTSITAQSRPPYPVTATTLALVDPSRSTITEGRTIATTRTLTTLVWAPVGTGPWPLVVFGHGYKVGPGPYAALLKAWAADGYVVAAPEFPLEDEFVAGADLDENDLDNEPGDLRYVIDAMVGSGTGLTARIDPNRVAVAGHSDGAEAALAESIAPPPAGEPAIRAVIAMSASPLSGISRLTNPPVLVTQGNADLINPFAKGQATFAQARSPRYFLTLIGGGHLPPIAAGSAWLPTIIEVTEDFLNVYVAGVAAPPALMVDSNHSPLTTLVWG